MSPETTLPAVPVSDELRRTLRTAGAKASYWQQERDRLIRQAVDEGGSLREVGELVGLSHTAVNFIARGRKK